MEALKNLNLRGLFRLMDSMNEDEFISWLQSLKLLHSRRICPSCGYDMVFAKEKDTRSKCAEKVNLLWRCNRRACPKKTRTGFFHGTFFEEHKLPLKEVGYCFMLLAVYVFYRYSCYHTFGFTKWPVIQIWSANLNVKITQLLDEILWRCIGSFSAKFVSIIS